MEKRKLTPPAKRISREGALQEWAEKVQPEDLKRKDFEDYPEPSWDDYVPLPPRNKFLEDLLEAIDVERLRDRAAVALADGRKETSEHLRRIIEVIDGQSRRNI